MDGNKLDAGAGSRILDLEDAVKEIEEYIALLKRRDAEKEIECLKAAGKIIYRARGLWYYERL